ncbi:MAG: EFR1 family ferrodoxin [Prevotellaceae bacterium]|jgi:ferredoxin|nr:EFR1 family ferrodoxin [Prevotellaceae bacterium]
MFSEIYYFSGTGNCLATARMINEKLIEKSSIVPISSIDGKQKIKADWIGFVFPVYCHKLPDIVKQFILRLEFTSSPYIYAVATNNGEPGQSLFDIQKLLTKKGQSLSLGIAIEMPGNAIETPFDIEHKRLTEMEQKVTEIAELIKVQKKGIIEGNNSLIELIRNQIVGFLAWNYIFSPKRYKVSDNCTGCGTCEKVCPINNIHLLNHKPIWGNKCATCLACFHWCPQEAIYDNIFIKKRRKYHHPDIRINDMFLQKP